MPGMIYLVVYALAVARITRLINADKITERPRKYLIRRAWIAAYPWVTDKPDEVDKNLRMVIGTSDPPKLAYFISCPWCVSLWVGLIAAPLAYFWGENPILAVPALALALSHFTGFLAEKE